MSHYQWNRPFRSLAWVIWLRLQLRLQALHPRPLSARPCVQEVLPTTLQQGQAAVERRHASTECEG